MIHYGGQTARQMARKFRLQLHGSELIFMKLHRSRMAFPLARFIMALFLLLRFPYWLAMAILHKSERNKSMETAGTYLIGGFYCLTNWKKLLMNKGVVKDKL